MAVLVLVVVGAGVFGDPGPARDARVGAEATSEKGESARTEQGRRAPEPNVQNLRPEGTAPAEHHPSDEGATGSSTLPTAQALGEGQPVTDVAVMERLGIREQTVEIRDPDGTARKMKVRHKSDGTLEVVR